MQKTWIQSLGQKDLLKKEMATPSLQYSCLGNLMDRGAQQATIQSMGLQRVGHDLVTLSNKNKANGVWQVHAFSGGHPAQLIPHCGLWFPECEDLQVAWQILSFLVLRYCWDFITNPSFYRKPQPLRLSFLE